MRIALAIPLFGVLLIIYNILMLTTSVFASEAPVISIPLFSSDDTLPLSGGSLFILFGICLLYVELLKAARAASSTIIDHVLSMVDFIICLVEFVVVPGAGTMAFLSLTLLSLLDVVAGFTVTIATARRDVAFGSER